MSGHSHAKTIKHQKELTDQKRGKVFSKLAKMLSVAAKEKGGDPNTNYALKIAMERAKEASMPQENIKTAIKRGTGELEGGAQLEEVIYEAYGPGGIAIIIEGITDNRNRALGEVKQALNQSGGKIVGEGAVKWMFERKGVISINIQNLKLDKEETELKMIEAGADDIHWSDEFLDIHTKIDSLDQTKKNIENQGVNVESASIDWVAKEEVAVDKKTKEDCEKLFDSLDESETVQNVYSNLKE